jgi:hypothetical protein
MTEQLKKYWRRVREIERGLPAVNFIVSLGDEMTGLVGGRVFVAPPSIAAARIVEKTHRLATADEISAYELDQTERRAGAEAEERLRHRERLLTLSPGYARAAQKLAEK